ncbi:hypothetical protein [Paenibacillus sp.]|uniref:hypothetical protein n=1 Tax=Paenibacillus sp. TaxID=58172 RepID=UPI002D3CEECE|nr:hypothetical protein [Paenibacillus sp.]HZG58317.1 hypothetical protein [Paenibacillus sp.]
MIGSWRWNAIAGVSFAALIFLLSFRNNPIETAGVRTGIAFAVAVAVAFAVRWMLGQALQGAASGDPGAEADGGEAAESDKGRSIDAVTPDIEDDIALDFVPLSPPKLAKTDPALDPELLAQALRHMSEK